MKKGVDRKTCLVCVTNGSEDLETVAIIDTLRRAPDLDVTVAKVLAPNDKEPLICNLMQGVKIVRIFKRLTIFQFADTNLEDISNDNFDIIVLPGGTGTVLIF